MSKSIDEYYIVRAESPDRPPSGDDRAATGFVTADGALGPFPSALRFDSLDSAERYVAARPPSPYRFLIQLCSREDHGPYNDDALHQLLERVMKIPPRYRRTAYNWLRGKNVEALLRRQGDEVYTRHRKVLANHDIDITRPSAVVLMRRKRDRIPINTGSDAGPGGPRQYVAPPSQRPSSAPIVRDGTGEED